MSMQFLGITWAAPGSLWILGVTSVAVLGLLYNIRAVKKVVKLLAVPEQYRRMLPGYSQTKFAGKNIALAGALIAASLALLKPQWGMQEHSVEQEGRELFIALDISRSMLAADIKPSRLAFAKSKIKKLVQMLPADRIGLVVFSGGAFVQCPLTRDTAAFNLFLDTVDVETFSSGTTSIAQAINTVMQTFATLPARKNKIVVLFTDGEDFSEGLGSIKEEAQKMGLTIVTYGVGTADGAPIPLVLADKSMQGYQKDAHGKVVISRLNEGILQSLAHDSGGIYISPTQGNQDLQQLVQKIQLYEKEKFENKKIETEQDRYYFFTGCAFLLLLLEWVL